jgi:hypothetical protein
VAGAGVGAQAVVSSAPLQPAATVLAALVALGAVLGAALWYRRRRRPGAASSPIAEAAPAAPAVPAVPAASADPPALAALTQR